MLERNLVLAEMVDASIAINFARKLPALYFDLEAKATWTRMGYGYPSRRSVGTVRHIIATMCCNWRSPACVRLAASEVLTRRVRTSSLSKCVAFF